MVNPCIVAAGPVTIRPDQPLALRDRLVVHDGEADAAKLEAHWADYVSAR